MHPFPEEKKVRHYLDSNFTNRPELVTPDPALSGNEEVGNVAVAASFIYQQVWQFDLRYSNSFGPIQNGATTRDRDFVSFTAKYTF